MFLLSTKLSRCCHPSLNLKNFSLGAVMSSKILTFFGLWKFSRFFLFLCKFTFATLREKQTIRGLGPGLLVGNGWAIEISFALTSASSTLARSTTLSYTSAELSGIPIIRTFSRLLYDSSISFSHLAFRSLLSSA